MKATAEKKKIGLKGGVAATGSALLCAALVAGPIAAFAADEITEQWAQGTDNVSYIGAEVDPVVLVNPSNSSSSLVKYREGSWYYENLYDYRVTYENNVLPGTATYQVTTRGNGNLSGTLEGQFTISAGDLSVASVSWAEGVNDMYVQTGEAIKPEIRLSLGSSAQGGAVYLPESDYTLVYRNADNEEIENPVAPGTYSVEATASSEYVTGTSSTLEFTILEEGTSIEGATVAPIGDQQATGNPIEPGVTVTLDGETLTAGKDYTVEYSDNVNVGTATATITGTGIYVGSVSTTFDIVAQDISGFSSYDFNLEGSGQYNTYPYTGSAIEPQVSISRNGYDLALGQDFELSYENNVDVWKASNLGREEGEVFDDEKPPTVVITGMGNFTGEYRVTFNIMPSVDLSSAVIDGTPALTFNGQTQPLHVNDFGRKYINLLPAYNMCAYGLADGAGVMFEESYRNADGEEIAAEDVRNAGSYTLVLTAIEGGGFTGSKEVGFTIDRASFSNVRIVDINNWVAFGEYENPTYTVTFGDYPLVLDEDYAVEFSGDTSASSGYVRATFTAQGNFKGYAVIRTFGYTVIDAEAVNAAWYQQGTDEASMVGRMMGEVRIGDADDQGIRTVYVVFGSGDGYTMDDVSVVDGATGQRLSDTVWSITVPESQLNQRIGVSFTYTVAAMGRTMTHAADMALSTDASAAVSETMLAVGTDSSEEAVAAARAVYDALPDFDRLFVSEDAVNALTDAETAVAEKKAARDSAAEVTAIIDALTDQSTADEVQAASDAYDALSDAAKALVGDAAKAKLATAKQRIADAANNDSSNNGGNSNDSNSGNGGSSDNGGDAPVSTARAFTVNAKTVTAKTVAAAARKAGATTASATSITLGKKVKKVKRGAFRAFKNVRTITVKTKKLTKRSVRSALKGSKVKTIKVNVGSKRANKKFAKKYKKVFAKANVGKKVKVKR